MCGHLLPRVFALALVVMGLVLPVVSARADLESDKRDCLRSNGQIRISACSRLLQSGRFDARDQSVTYFNRGTAYASLKQHRRAIQDYNEALRLNPRNTNAYNNRGIVYRRQKQYRRAIQDYDAAIRINPRFAPAYFNRGIAYFELKQLRRAIKDYDETIRLNPRYAKAYRMRGLAHEALGQKQAAMRDYQMAERLRPRKRASSAWEERFWDCYRSADNYRRISGCTQIVNSSSESRKNRVIAYAARGIAYGKLKQYRRAIQDFNEALRLNPRYALAYASRGIAYKKLKQYGQALQDYNEAIRLNPRYAFAYHNRGNAYFSLKRYRHAIQDYNEALRLNPRIALTHYQRGNAYDKLGRKQEAVRDYRTALRLNPNLRQARDNLKRLGVKPTTRPHGAAPTDAVPRCRDVGGYEAYMKRTGKVCRID